MTEKRQAPKKGGLNTNRWYQTDRNQKTTLHILTIHLHLYYWTYEDLNNRLMTDQQTQAEKPKYVFWLVSSLLLSVKWCISDPKCSDLRKITTVMSSYSNFKFNALHGLIHWVWFLIFFGGKPSKKGQQQILMYVWSIIHTSWLT